MSAYDRWTKDFPGKEGGISTEYPSNAPRSIVRAMHTSEGVYVQVWVENRGWADVLISNEDATAFAIALLKGVPND